jgi:hypothetical protein
VVRVVVIWGWECQAQGARLTVAGSSAGWVLCAKPQWTERTAAGASPVIRGTSTPPHQTPRPPTPTPIIQTPPPLTRTPPQISQTPPSPQPQPPPHLGEKLLKLFGHEPPLGVVDLRVRAVLAAVHVLTDGGGGVCGSVKRRGRWWGGVDGWSAGAAGGAAGAAGVGLLRGRPNPELNPKPGAAPCRVYGVGFRPGWPAGPLVTLMKILKKGSGSQPLTVGCRFVWRGACRGV